MSDDDQVVSSGQGARSPGDVTVPASDANVQAVVDAAHAEYTANKSHLDISLAVDRHSQRSRLAEKLHARRASSYQANAARSDALLTRAVNDVVGPRIDEAREVGAVPAEEGDPLPFRHNYEARLLLDAVDAALVTFAEGGLAEPSPDADPEGDAEDAFVERFRAAVDAHGDPRKLENNEILARVGGSAAPLRPVDAWDGPPAADDAAAVRRSHAEDVRAILALLRGSSMVDAEEHAAGEAQVTVFVDRFRGRDDILSHMPGAWMDAHNRLGILWSNRSEPSKGLAYLIAAEEMYRDVRGRHGTLTASDPGPVAEVGAHVDALREIRELEAAQRKTPGEGGEEEQGEEQGVGERAPEDGKKSQDTEDGDGTGGGDVPAGGADGDGGGDLPARDGPDGDGSADRPSTAGGARAVTPCVLASLRAADDVESLYTHTTFYLAQCYGSLDPPRRNLASYYVLLTLRRQMMDVTGRPGLAFNPVEWATNCISLSQFFTVENQFGRADQCLQAARKVLPKTADRELIAKLDATAGRHCRNLLDLSRKRLNMQRFGDDGDEAGGEAGGEGAAPASTDPDCDLGPSGSLGGPGLASAISGPLFPTMNLAPAQRTASTFDEARELFNAGMEHYNAALKFFVFEGFVTDHCTIVQDISAMYKTLAAFENPDNVQRRIAMQKRRAALLEPMLEMNANAYHALYKGLTFEVAEVYSEISDLLRDKHTRGLREDTPIPTSKAAKINEYIVKSIGVWNIFLKSFEHQGTLPEKLEEELIDPFLTGHFYLARLYSRIVVPSVAAQCDNLRKSLERFQYVVEYVEKRDLPNLPAEVDVCRQMAELIPLKLDRLVQTARLDPEKAKLLMN